MLFSKFDQVKEYYESTLTDSSEILAEYKAKLEKEYMPKRGYGKARSSEARKIVSEFKKVAKNVEDVIELILYRAEIMLAFTNAYGDIDMPFYDTLCRAYEEACKLIVKYNLQEKYKAQCEGMIDKTRNFGWGVTDDMEQVFEEYFKA
jgi:HEPN domain-containing protein